MSLQERQAGQCRPNFFKNGGDQLLSESASSKALGDGDVLKEEDVSVSELWTPASAASMVRILVVFGLDEAVCVQQIECQAKGAWASLGHVVPERVAFTSSLDEDGLAGGHLHGVISDFEYGGSLDVAHWHGAVFVVSLAECRHIELEPESLVGGRDSAKGGIWMGRAICAQVPEV